jgi:excinuclease UvrABC ATPase subunit
VLVVEHDTDVITAADHVIELGPRAGTDGGRVVYDGDVAGLATAGTLTGEFLHRPVRVRATVRTPTGSLQLTDASAYNLRGFDVDVPLGVLVAITGVAGSGKSTLVREVLLPQHPDTVVVDQPPVATSIRSTPATWTGVMDPLRKLYAKAHGVKPGLFSFNSDGACPTCNGLGAVYADLAFLDGVRSTCPDCGGRRYTDEVLALTVDGRSISDTLDLTTATAVAAFPQPDIRRRLQAVVDVGLGYLTLGQPLSTLSGGECQRLKAGGPAARAGAPRVGRAVRPGRAHHGPAHVRLRAPAGAAGPAGRRRRLGDRRRAQPGRRRARRLGDRPRPGRRRRRRGGGLHGHPRRPVRGRGAHRLAHGRAPGPPRARLTPP